jgi:ATP-dependent 26S proteasome regulatory subunit
MEDVIKEIVLFSLLRPNIFAEVSPKSLLLFGPPDIDVTGRLEGLDVTGWEIFFSLTETDARLIVAVTAGVIKEIVLFSLLRPNIFTELKEDPPKSLLLFGLGCVGT